VISDAIRTVINPFYTKEPAEGRCDYLITLRDEDNHAVISRVICGVINVIAQSDYGVIRVQLPA
jgi:hypothetical protein